MSRHVELVYFNGCPNVERARANLRSARRVEDVHGASDSGAGS